MMDLDTAAVSKPRASWVEPEVIQKRRTEGRCLRCGAMKHQIRQCPYAPAMRPKQQPIEVRNIDEYEEIERNDETSLK